MNAFSNNTLENKSQSIANAVSQKKSKSRSTFQFIDNRPEAITQRKLQAVTDNYTTQHTPPIQKKENNTGLPDNLKSGIENLSRYSLDDVKVHYNSDKPAQLQAHAYAQGVGGDVLQEEKISVSRACHIVYMTRNIVLLQQF